VRQRSRRIEVELVITRQLFVAFDVARVDKIRDAEAVIFAAMAQLPVNRLMLAVLDRAVNDFRIYAAVPTGRGRRLFADVAAWFRSSTDRAFDFEMICHATGLDPDFIRKGLRSSYGGACRQTPIRMAPRSEIAVASARHPRPDGRFRGRRAAVRGLAVPPRGRRHVAP
jgi:hypothetical protein